MELIKKNPRSTKGGRNSPRKSSHMYVCTASASIFLEDSVGIYEIKVEPKLASFHHQRTNEILGQIIHLGTVDAGISIRMKSKVSSLKNGAWSNWLPIAEVVNPWVVVDGSGDLPINFKNTTRVSQETLQKIGARQSSTNANEELIRKELETYVLNRWRIDDDVFILSNVSKYVTKVEMLQKVDVHSISAVHGQVDFDITPSKIDQADRLNEIIAKGSVVINVSGIHRFFRTTVFIRASLKSPSYEERINPRWSKWQNTDVAIFEFEYRVFASKSVEFKSAGKEFSVASVAFSELAPKTEFRDRALKLSEYDKAKPMTTDDSDEKERLDKELRSRFAR